MRKREKSATCVALGMERDWQERKRHFSNSYKFKKNNSLILDKIFKIEKIGKIGNLRSLMSFSE